MKSVMRIQAPGNYLGHYQIIMSRKQLKRRKQSQPRHKRSRGGNSSDGIGSEDFDYTLDPIRVPIQKKRSLKEKVRKSLRSLSRKFARIFNNYGMRRKRGLHRIVEGHKKAVRQWKDVNSVEGPKSHIGKPLRVHDLKSWQQYLPGDTYDKKIERDRLKAEVAAEFFRT